MVGVLDHPAYRSAGPSALALASRRPRLDAGIASALVWFPNCCSRAFDRLGNVEQNGDAFFVGSYHVLSWVDGLFGSPRTKMVLGVAPRCIRPGAAHWLASTLYRVGGNSPVL